MEKEEIKKVMTYLGKLSHKKSPRSKKYYRDIAKLRWLKHNLKKNKK